MRRVETAVRLRIFLGEDDKYKGRPMYEEIVVQAQASHLSGATVFQGYMGYGATSGLHAAKILRASHDLPIIVEILDSEEKVNAFLDVLDKLLGGGVATVEKVQLYRYSRDKKKPAGT
jgi:PII-like signaling protein